jgi:hypothetical protein
MEQFAQIKTLLEKIELLEAKAAMIHQEAGEIKTFLLAMAAPENKLLRGFTLRQLEKLKADAEVESLAKVFVNHHLKRMHKNDDLMNEVKVKGQTNSTPQENIRIHVPQDVEKSRRFKEKRTVAAKRK